MRVIVNDQIIIEAFKSDLKAKSSSLILIKQISNIQIQAALTRVLSESRKGVSMSLSLSGEPSR